MERKIKIFDTTLRDGEQSPGCSMNLEEKIEVARQLERLGVDWLEAGFAVTSRGDFDSVEAIAKTVKNAGVASLARTTERDIDVAYEAIRGAVCPRLHLFLATSPLHMRYKLHMSEDQVLETVAAMVCYAKKYISDVEFSAEDATRSDRDFLVRVLETALRSGATTLNLPDTVGYAMPEEMHDLIHYVMERTDGIGRAVLSVHCHNDLGLAVANSLAAVSAGACQVECTVNGIGERAGNAALEEIVMALHTRRDTLCASTGIHMRQIYRTSKLLYNIIGTAVPMNKPIVGANAFKHEAGIHQHGVLENTATYEIMSPETIGVPKNHMVLGKHSGKHAFQTRLSELGYSLSEEETARYFREFKTLCDKKKDITDSDLEAIVNNRVPDQHVYQLDRFDVHAGNFATASCVIRLKKGETVIEDVALGDGPIDAAYHAIDRIVCPPPHILDDYSIHSVSDGKDALGEVLVKIKCGEKVINGRGLSTDIIESSILAYLNAVNRLLSQS